MRKVFLFILVLFFINISTIAQCIEKSYIDNITNSRIIETSWEHISKNGIMGKNYTSIRLALVNNKIYFHIKILTAQTCDVKSGNEIIFKNSNGDLNTLSSVEQKRSGNGEGATGKYGASMEGIYVRYAGDISFMENDIDEIKANLNGLLIDITVSDKGKIKIKELFKIFSDEIERNNINTFSYQKFELEKKDIIGKIFVNKKVKANYEVIDAIMKVKEDKYINEEKYPELHYIVRNSVTKKEYCYPANIAENECFREDLSGKYITTLSKVEKPSNESIRYGEISIIEKDGITKYGYKDDIINILILGSRSQFEFILENVSKHSIKIIWDEAVFVNFEGMSSKIIHTGIKYSQRDSEQPPTTIISNSKINEIALPIQNIIYSNVLKEWITTSMYPSIPDFSKSQLKLMLPIQIKDIVNEYIFVFDLTYIYDHPERINL